VREARSQKSAAIEKLFADAGVAYPPAQVLLRVYKDDDLLELWAGDAGEPLVRIKGYPICSRSGELGPKRRRGDLQVPEGFYHVDRFNAWSNFHLSLGINYPNDSDRALGYQANLGGDIFIHGDCVTIGCVPIETEPIKELYLIALDARLAGRTVHVHIFPRALDEAGLAALATRAGDDAALQAFWRGLAPGWEYFENNRRLPKIRVDKKSGAYRVSAP
jgi:murein L,D-transpeptidase YafK